MNSEFENLESCNSGRMYTNTFLEIKHIIRGIQLSHQYRMRHVTNHNSIDLGLQYTVHK